MAKPYGIHWFRRDLRVAGNKPLERNRKENDGRTVGVFCFDKKFLSRDDFSANRFQFFIETLSSLHAEMREIGSDLLFMDIGPQDAFPKLLKMLKREQGGFPALITWSRDYEPFARNRDKEMKSYFRENNIATFIERDHLLIEPHELSKKNKTDEYYQVYSPFARQWLKIFQDDEVATRVKEQKQGFDYLKKLEQGKVDKTFNLTWNQLLNDKKDSQKIIQEYKKNNQKNVTIEIPDAGSLAAYKKLKSFKKRLSDYDESRNFPSQPGTSGFSIFFKNGSLTVPQVINYFDFTPYKKKKTSQDSFFSELIWREFYFHILFHHPNVEKEAFLKQYRNLRWQNNQAWFERWKAGTTGFPIVDAGMRELKTTGLMHNRLRMVVASFLTKDLLIDWRWGEKHFMDLLLDGDLAANNGGWQWAASTGCDPQPYFRIFNPWTQGKKFDPDGEYIKKFVPELKNVESKKLHQPIEDHESYPTPIVDHSEQREKALAMYKEARGS